jgi:hypothetical protein
VLSLVSSLCFSKFITLLAWKYNIGCSFEGCLRFEGVHPIFSHYFYNLMGMSQFNILIYNDNLDWEASGKLIVLSEIFPILKYLCCEFNMKLS